MSYQLIIHRQQLNIIHNIGFKRGIQCSRIRILRFFQISKNMTLRFLNDVSKSRKKSVAKV